MPLDYNIPMSSKGIQMPNFLGMLKEGQQIGKQRREQQGKQLLGDLFKSTNGDLTQMAQGMGAQGYGQEALELKSLDSEQKASQKKAFDTDRDRQVGIMAKFAPHFLKLNDQERIEQFPKMMQGLQNEGVKVSDNWTPEEAVGAFEWAFDEAGKGKDFADTKMQKFPGKDGFMRNYNPSTGAASLVLDQDGNKVPVKENFMYVKTTDGYTPLSTSQPPTKAPDAVPGLTPADEKKRKLAEKQALLNLEKTNQAIAKAAQDAADGGQFKASQYQASTYGQRMEEATIVMDKLVSEGFDRTDFGSGFLDKLPNVLKTSEVQQQGQAERNFVNAVLRRESGAAIAPSEFASAEKQYFPRSGDSPEVLVQKKANRETAISGMKAEAGGAWDEVKSKRPDISNDDVGYVTERFKVKYGRNPNPNEIELMLQNYKKGK